jgi:hypothetical protein
MALCHPKPTKAGAFFWRLPTDSYSAQTGTSARAMEGIRVNGDYSRPACYPPGMSRLLVLLLAGSLLASCAVFEPIGNFLAEAKALGFEPHLNQS